MQTNYVFLCEETNVAANGTVTALGIFESIVVTQLPFSCPKMIYVVSIKGEPCDIGFHEFLITVTTKQGDITLAHAHGVVEFKNEILSPIIIADFSFMNFYESNVHYVKLSIDGKKISEIPVNVAFPKITFANFGNDFMLD